MNEWPTRVRTGMPPFSRMTSGSAFEQMRLCTIVSPGCFARMPAGDDRRRGGARHRLTLVVDEEDAIGVAVERESDIGARVEHRALQVLEVLGLDRVGGVVREGAVELAVEDPQVEGQTVEHARHDQAAHAVGGVGDDPQRPQHRGVDEAPHVGTELLEHVDGFDGARDLGPLDDAGLDRGPDLAQSGLLADRRGSGAAQLDAVVLRGVVAGGEHRRRCVEAAGREVREVGRGQTEIGDVGTREVDTFRERLRERNRRRAHVARHEHAVGAREAGERVPDPASDGLVDLVGVHTTDVVGLEDGVQRHRRGSSADVGSPDSGPGHGSAGTSFGRPGSPPGLDVAVVVPAVAAPRLG